MRYRSSWGLGSAIRLRYAPARAREPRDRIGGAGLMRIGITFGWLVAVSPACIVARRDSQVVGDKQ